MKEKPVALFSFFIIVNLIVFSRSCQISGQSIGKCQKK